MVRLTLKNRALLALFLLLVLTPIVLSYTSPTTLMDLSPWTVWVMGWVILLWIASIEYSLKRKEVFDQTSAAFFKAYLDHLIREGSSLFNQAEDGDFYLKIGEWQRQAIQGIAIGLGPEESRKFFQKIDSQNPLSEAHKESVKIRSNEPPCRTLQANLDELNVIRLRIANPTEKGLARLDPKTQVKLPPDIKQIEGPK
jgi:hypothetical protein